VDLVDDEGEEGVGVHGDDLVDEVLYLEVPDVHLVDVLQLLPRRPQVLLHAVPLALAPLQEDDLYVVLYHRLVVPILRPVVLLVDAVQLALLQSLRRRTQLVFQVLVLLDFVDVYQLA
jgi:hypothetical protein